MSNFIDLTGQKFGRLTVIRKAKNPSEAHIKWLCECECGNFITTRASNLRRGITKSCGCLVSDKIKNYYWYSNRDGYMCRRENKKEIIMHRLIIDENDPEMQVDHFNRNKKDNRKENLKSVTPQHNNWNRGMNQNNKSGVTGVRWNKEAQKWVAYIMCKHLGTFNSFEDAVEARKRAEQKYFGEYSYNNINNQKQNKKTKDGE